MTPSQDLLGKTLAAIQHCREPAFPPVMAQLLKELVAPEPDFKAIAQVIGMDPVLTATVLNLVNSSFYSLTQKIKSLKRATVVLGSREILKIALSLSFLGHQARTLDKAGGDSYRNWRLVVWAAVATQLIAERLCPEQSDKAYLCALLKDLSLLVMWSADPGAVPAMADGGLLVCLRPGQLEAEAEGWGAAHPELTLRLLADWGLPDLGCDAIASHHDLDDLEGLAPVAQALALGTRWSELVNACQASPLPLVQFENLLQTRLAAVGANLEQLRQVCVQRFRSMLDILGMDEDEPDRRLYDHSVQTMQNYYFQSMDIIQVRGGPLRAAEAVARHLRWNFDLDAFDLCLRQPGSDLWLLFSVRPGRPPEQAGPAAPPQDLAKAAPDAPYAQDAQDERFPITASGESWGELRTALQTVSPNQRRELSLYLNFVGRAYLDYCRRQAVLESKARTLDTLPVGVARLDSTGRVLELNHILYQFLGAPANPQGADIGEFFSSPLGGPRAAREWKAFMDDPRRDYMGRIYCAPAAVPDRPYRCFYLSARRTEHQGRDEILFMIEDVSEVSELELQAFKQGAFLEQLVESMQDLVMTVDAAGTIAFASPRLSEALTGKNLFHIARPMAAADDALAGAFGPKMLEEAAAPVEVSLNAGGASPLRLELVISPLESETEAKAFLIVGRDLTTIRRLEEKLKRQAVYDGLTGLFNRFQFHAILNRETRRARRTDRGMGLIFFDLDGFKKINDTQGHQAGDQVLRDVAQALWESLRKGMDFPCRYGGDEFAVIVTEVDEAALLRLGERIMRAMARRFEGHPGLSMGLDMLERDENPEALVRRCDEAAYRAKAGGGNAMARAC